ncbi:TetR/AcrR family transcriptional regulator [Nevskia soli]|uniref:TetR/AcrR family transcriptional regulator n=1 Tax=Nevskia soli TaxID=418856 RepID=UPI0004A6F62C|nr:TetR/AcrR family transcriptional regulator [Nevskia soli]
MSKKSELDPPLRGPTDHAVRDQIVVAAKEHFSRYGYDKTTVSDLAEAIGFSKAYIYRFFESKQAIGEAICSQCLSSIANDVEAALARCKSPIEKIRVLFKTAIESSVALFFTERKLYDIAAHSASEKWRSIEPYEQRIFTLLQDILKEGRKVGEFERKTAVDESCRAILQAMQPFLNPLMLQQNLEKLPEGATEVVSLILRSLAP